jgi:hypothetical protein
MLMVQSVRRRMGKVGWLMNNELEMIGKKTVWA